ncbi:MAG: GTPase HflX [Planctomycetota bacterium]
MPPPKERENIKVRAEKAVLAAVRLPGSNYDPRDPFGELRELATQAGATIVGEVEQHRNAPVAGTFMGRGKLEELKGLCAVTDAATIIFDHELSPKQIAAIEKSTERKVIDRSELILDIFASRATTHEAKLQVEIAQLEYTFPRLRAMWDHLERITGGSPGGVGTRGPGEQQLEIDRRLVQRRKKLLTRQLEDIQARKRRTVQDRTAEHFTAGLVGYTNAGKSTLFNTLTAGGAYADDRVFATLMTRTREWDLGGGQACMLSDTVGFVRDLPHHLVASFRATLEEATHADVLLIVLDVSDPSAELHYETVSHVLDELVEEVRDLERKAAKEGDGDADALYQPPERILLLNKADRLLDNRELLVWQSRVPDSIPICSLAPEASEDASPVEPRLGQAELARRVREIAAGPAREVELTVPMRTSRAVQAIEHRGEVHERAYEGDLVRYRVTIGSRILARLAAAEPSIKILGEPVHQRRAWAPAPEED